MNVAEKVSQGLLFINQTKYWRSCSFPNLLRHLRVLVISQRLLTAVKRGHALSVLKKQFKRLKSKASVDD
jgi:hypothetical protein